jgi:LmbE family N-acetylglucosaminyl deacetylase
MIAGVALLAATGRMAAARTQQQVPPRTASAQPRVMVFAPHPDDETIAAGGLIARLVASRIPVEVVFLTNGDGYTRAVEENLGHARPTGADFVALGRLRQQEALAAARHLGLEPRMVRFLGFPDGGLADLWHDHWARPYASPFTHRDRPPYTGIVSSSVTYDGQDLTAVIARLLEDFRPSIVLMPHPADHHPDHVHTSYFVTEALTKLQVKGALPQRVHVLGYLVHYPAWPATRGPAFDRLLPVNAVADARWRDVELTNEERDAKRAALGDYRSQLGVMRGFLRGFLCRNELLLAIDARVLERIASVH